MNKDEMIAAARAAAENLGSHCVDAKPINIDFGGTMFDEDGEERWSYLEAMRCESCEQVIVDGNEHGFVDENGDAVELTDDVDPDDGEQLEALGYEECPAHGQDARDLYAEGPMMNYMYPLGRDSDYSEDNARKLVDHPLCLVYKDDEAYLALTGGGMDLSWDICSAYITLGYLPPTHFSLPEMAGLRLTQHNANIVAAVERSCDLQAGWAERRRDNARRMFDTLESEND